MSDSNSSVPYRDWKMKQGATIKRNYYLKNANGTAKDLTSFTAKCEIRDKPGGNVILSLTSSPAAGITITAATGLIAVVITKTQSAAFNFTVGEYDMRITNASSEDTYIAEGKVYLTPRITQ
jgi:hypothetical protein